MRTLAGRVTLLATVACAGVFLVVGAVLIAEVGRRERATLDRELRATAIRLQAPARRGQTAQLQRLAGGATVALLQRGQVVFSTGAEVPVPKAGLSTRDGWRMARRGKLVVARPLAEVESRISELRRVIAITALLGLLTCALAVRLAVAHALRPLERLRASAASVSSTRDLTTRIEQTGPAEVDEVAGALNAMLARLEASVAAIERFTADAGHELRTPLTAIRTNLASLAHEARAFGAGAESGGGARAAAGALSPAERGRALAELERDVARLAALLDALQALARGDAGAVEHEPVNLGDLADAAVIDARRRYPGVDFGLEGEATAVGDESGLRSVLDNLLENAARHGAQTVRVTLAPGRLTVDDDGPGIPESERERVFERFAKGPTGGSGLGLAIVAQQAALHGGRAFIEESSAGGTRVVVTMRG